MNTEKSIKTLKCHNSILNENKPILNINPDDVIFKIGDKIKKVTKFKYNPFHGGYDIEWE